MMDTPEKETLLETVRALRKEAAEKLTGNRHDQAIQRLDEILEVVEKQDMSAAEISAVSNVLVGKVDTAPSAEPVEAVVETMSEAPAVDQDIVVFENGAEETVSLPEVVASPSVVSDVDEVLVDLGTPEIEVPGAISEMSDGVVEVVPEIAVEEQSGLGMGMIASLGAGALAAGAIAKNLVSETKEVAPDVGLIDLPEASVETPEIELAEVGAPVLGAEADASLVELVEVTDVLDIEAPVGVVPDVEMAPVAAIEAPEAIEAPGAIEIDEIDPLDALAVEQAAEVDLAALELDVPMEENLHEVEISAPAVPELGQVEVPSVADIDPATAAIVAAGAAATVAAVAAGRTDTEVEAAPVATTPRVHTGGTLKRHPTYGGGRGNWFVRFINTLRGKDYI